MARASKQKWSWRRLPPRTWSRVFTSLAWVAWLALWTWALADVFDESVGAATAWKLGGGVLCLGSGGVGMLVVVIRNGLAECPPRLWFTGVREK